MSISVVCGGDDCLLKSHIGYVVAFLGKALHDNLYKVMWLRCLWQMTHCASGTGNPKVGLNTNAQGNRQKVFGDRPMKHVHNSNYL